MLFLTFSLVLVLFSWDTSSQHASCPTTFPEECTCYDDWEYGPVITCVTIPMSTWDVKATFDEISDTINNSSAVMENVYVQFFDVSEHQEIPANSISNLKTKTLSIQANSKLTRIDPQAFSGTHDSVQSLHFADLNFTNAQDFYDLANNFKQLYVLSFYGGKLQSLPTYAVGADLEQLRYVNIVNSGLTSIADLALSGPPNLEWINLMGNNLTLDQISDSAFVFTRLDVYLNLEQNPGITHLPEEKFGNFLRDNNNAIYVGPGTYGGCNPADFLSCDERTDWICSSNSTRIYGYYCQEIEYIDIFEYCQHQFGYSPLDKIENPRELKRIELEDHLRRETFRIEEKHIRREATLHRFL